MYIKKRWDLIPNLVEVVKGYANVENNTFTEIAKIRSNAYENISMDKKIDLNEQLTQSISKIMILSENYPELKSSENFLLLSKDLTKVEDDIANSRKYYNGAVRILNNKVQMFPNNIVAKMFGFKEAKMFDIDENEKNNINVKI